MSHTSKSTVYLDISYVNQHRGYSTATTLGKLDMVFWMLWRGGMMGVDLGHKHLALLALFNYVA